MVGLDINDIIIIMIIIMINISMIVNTCNNGNTNQLCECPVNVVALCPEFNLIHQLCEFSSASKTPLQLGTCHFIQLKSHAP